MHTMDEFRAGMARESAGIVVNVGPAQVRARARTRQRRMVMSASGLVALVAVGVGGSAALTGSAGDAAVPGIGSASPDASASTGSEQLSGDPPQDPTSVINTGLRLATGEEVVLWLNRGTTGTTLSAALRPPGGAGTVPLATGVATTEQSRGFAELRQIDARGGKVIEYGFYVGSAARVTTAADGVTVTAEVKRLDAEPSVLVFWSQRSAPVLVPALSPDATAVRRPAAGQPVFTAHDAAGRISGTSTGLVTTRADASYVTHGQRRAGDLIRTGHILGNGDELVLWFWPDGQAVGLGAGARDPRTGDVRQTVGGGRFDERDGTGFSRTETIYVGQHGKQIAVSHYIGPADRVTVTGPPGSSTGSARWSERRDVVAFWAGGVSPDSSRPLTATAYDKAGRQIDTFAGTVPNERPPHGPRTVEPSGSARPSN